MNIAHFLRQSAICFPDRPAISWRGSTIDYRTFDRRSSAFATWLNRGRHGSRRRVVLFLDNRPELLIVMFGVFQAGGAVLPANSRLTDDELRFIIEDGEATVVITDPAHEETARRAAEPNGAEVLVAGADLVDVLESEPDGCEVVDCAPDDAAWIFYTSGTTGRPKGAMLSHSVLNFVTVSWLADLTPLDETDVTLHAAPLSHGAGFHALAATARATHQIILDSVSFDTAVALDAIRSHGVTNTWMVPTQIVMLTDKAIDLGVTASDLPSLRYVVYGGAPMTPAAMTRALEVFGSVFVQLFGQGESPMMITFLRRQDHVPRLLGSAGRVRPGIEVRIVGADDREVPTGEVGEIVVRGPSVMTGYLNLPEATAETLRGGWLHTGDLGRFTDDGILHLLDRAKDMIISGGSNVYAVEVEDVLARHPDIREVAVIGLPDDLWGELVVAVVVAADAAAIGDASLRATLSSSIDEHARGSLAGYKIPRRIEFVEALPRNAYGKVLKRNLRSSFSEGSGQ